LSRIARRNDRVVLTGYDQHRLACVMHLRRVAQWYRALAKASGRSSNMACDIGAVGITQRDRASKVPPADRTGMILRSASVAQTLQISLFGSETSLLARIISLLIFAAKLQGNRCGTGAFRPDVASKSPQIAEFPVYFPDSRELRAETGSYLTAHTTILIFRRLPRAAIRPACDRPFS